MRAEEINLMEELSTEGRSWLRDLAAHKEDTGFPDVNLRSASGLDCVLLADYLASDDGSLSPSDLAFSRQIADEVLAIGAHA